MAQSTDAGLLKILNSKKSIRQYSYSETVVIKGDITHYLWSLHEYFTDEIWATYEHFKTAEKQMIDIASSIGKKTGTRRYADVFEKLRAENAEDALLKLKSEKFLWSQMHLSQRVNLAQVKRVQGDKKYIGSLDMTNYSRINPITTITTTADGSKDHKLLIRIFYNKHQPKEHVGIAEKFAGNARGYCKDVDITCEAGVKNELQTLEYHATHGKIYSAKDSLIHKGIIPVIHDLDDVTYSIPLTKIDIDILKLFVKIEWGGEKRGLSSKTRESIILGNIDWSPNQVERHIEEMLGILGIYAKRTMNKRTRYMNFNIPEQNIDAVNSAKDNAIFRKTITTDDVKVLSTVYRRTMELRERYGQGFYPRLYTGKIAKDAEMDLKICEQHLQSLTGLLAEQAENNLYDTGKKSFIRTSTRWFIPKSRMQLVEQIVKTA
jgi:hypothetical protein